MKFIGQCVCVLAMSSIVLNNLNADGLSHNQQALNPVQRNAINTFSYDGEYQDPTTNLVYLRARNYDPNTQRFITRDDYNVLNKYSFTDANPVNNIDPNGHMPNWVNYILGGLVIVGAVVPGYWSASAGLPLIGVGAALGGLSGATSITTQALVDMGAIAQNSHTARTLSKVGFWSGIAGIAIDLGNIVAGYRDWSQYQVLKNKIQNQEDFQRLIEDGSFLNSYEKQQQTLFDPSSDYHTPLNGEQAKKMKIKDLQFLSQEGDNLSYAYNGQEDDIPQQIVFSNRDQRNGEFRGEVLRNSLEQYSESNPQMSFHDFIMRANGGRVSEDMINAYLNGPGMQDIIPQGQKVLARKIIIRML